MIKWLTVTSLTTREESYQGRKHLVVSVVALVEGVVQAMNAPSPEYVSVDEYSRFVEGWNGRPVFVDHPMSNGKPISGNSPAVLEGSVGLVFNATVKKNKLTMEAWIDVDKAEKIAPELLERLAQGDPIEVSAGLFADTDDSIGVFDGKKYKGAWHNIVPDHLALLSKGREGACSRDMGCGVRAAEVRALVIRKEGDKWCLYSKDGDKNLGCFDTKAGAEKRERQVQFFKHRAAGGNMDETIERWLSTDPVVPVSWVEKVCPACAEKMRSLNVTHLKIAQMPPALLAGLCDKFGAEDGFRTRCMDASLEAIDDQAAFCNWLKGQCHGTKAAEKKKDRTFGAAFARIMAAFRGGAQHPTEMSGADLMRKLNDALREVEPQLNYVETYYPVTAPNRVVYAIFHHSEHLRFVLYERSFNLSDDGVLTLGDGPRVEVEPVLSYEPVAAENTTKDQAKIQAMHDHAMALGAHCTPKAAEGGRPCGCHKINALSQESDMNKEAIVKFLETATAAQLTALGQTIEGTNPAVKAAQEAQAKAEADLKAAQDQAKIDAKAAADKATADQKAVQENPEYVAFKAAQAEKKAATIKTLKDTGRCKLTDEVLASKTQAELDQLVELAGVPKATATDFSGQGGPKNTQTNKVAPVLSFADALKASREKK